MDRPVALMMPRLAEAPRSNGLPMAKTCSPTRTLSESPQGSGLRSCAAIRSIATSMRGSSATLVAGKTRWSCNWTSMDWASSTTWLLVTMRPSFLITTPAP